MLNVINLSVVMLSVSGAKKNTYLLLLSAPSNYSYFSPKTATTLAYAPYVTKLNVSERVCAMICVDEK
jgi:hypothetical protein